MNVLSIQSSRLLRLPIRTLLQQPSTLRSALILPPPTSSIRYRCFRNGTRLFAAEESQSKEEGGNEQLKASEIFPQFKASYNGPPPTFDIFNDRSPLDILGTEVSSMGFLETKAILAHNLIFAHVNGGPKSNTIQLLSRDKDMCKILREIRNGSAIRFTGIVSKREDSRIKKALIQKGESKPLQETELQELERGQLEIVLSELTCLNEVHKPLGLFKKHVFGPEERHLQIRTDKELKERLWFRSEVAKFIRQEMEDFQEIETPILFKSTPEGAREFLVPTRREGFAYALPQSPQQYKQILMASGIYRYIQFAKCFRDEDLRADRQPEFTQVDLEMAFASGEDVMIRVEKLMKALFAKFAAEGTPIPSPLPDAPFIRMPYEKAMSRYGSDKPDLRIRGLIRQIDPIVPKQLSGMLTKIPKPIIEGCKFRFDCSPKELNRFISKFMDSPEAEAFRLNPDGAPGFCIFDSQKPLEGLQAFGFEAAEQLKDFYKIFEGVKEEDSEFKDGDILLIQPRKNKPHSGGSTMLGKLRLAIHKAALAEGLIQEDKSHKFLWVVDFPMFTPDNAEDPGQGGTAGFSATHHPFTAPKTEKDVDLLLTDPLSARADHYDLVLNGVELGGGSRRIHSAEMQKFIMRNILKMSEPRISDFIHLFSALSSGCPPHAGLALGFDRLIAIMTGRESVKDVIAFPKSSKGEDMMVKSPSEVTDEQLAVYHLQREPTFKKVPGFPAVEPRGPRLRILKPRKIEDFGEEGGV